MSKIYIIGGKYELIDAINNNKLDTTVTLTFIKKYHKYYKHLLFFPTVLANMIFDYINDIFEIKCMTFLPYTYEKRLKCSNDIQLNFDIVHLDFSIHIHFLWKKMISCHVKRIYNAIIKSDVFYPDNKHYCMYFLNKYYTKKKSYIRNGENYDEITKNIDNLKHYKNELIIIQKIMNVIKRFNLLNI